MQKSQYRELENRNYVGEIGAVAFIVPFPYLYCPFSLPLLSFFPMSFSLCLFPYVFFPMSFSLCRTDRCSCIVSVKATAPICPTFKDFKGLYCPLKDFIVLFPYVGQIGAVARVGRWKKKSEKGQKGKKDNKRKKDKNQPCRTNRCSCTSRSRATFCSYRIRAWTDPQPRQRCSVHVCPPGKNKILESQGPSIFFLY
jgi:hypothetical protein